MLFLRRVCEERGSFIYVAYRVIQLGQPHLFLELTAKIVCPFSYIKRKKWHKTYKVEKIDLFPVFSKTGESTTSASPVVGLQFIEAAQ